MLRAAGWRITISIIVCLWVNVMALHAANDLVESEDGQLLKGLRQRGLFEAARHHCQARLQVPDISMAERTEWTMEWIRTHAQHALSLPADTRPDQWQQARKVAADYLQRYPRSPQRVLIQVQASLTALARGELLQQEATVAFRPAETLEAARGSLREAVRGLEQLDATLSRTLPGSSQQAGPDVISRDRLMTLQYHVQYQLARAYRNQALCYPEGSADRIAALQKALDQLAKPLTQLAKDDVLVGPIQRDQAICLRWLGKLAEARQIIGQLHQADRDPKLQLEARAELIWIELVAGQLDRALELVQQPRQLGSISSPELDLVRLETSLLQWQQARQANQAEVAQQWQQRAVAMVRFMESEHGSYWGRRGEMRLLKVAGRDTSNLEILHRTADDLYLKGKLEEALAAYEQAGTLAQQGGAMQEAFQLWYKAALVEQKRNRPTAYVARLRKLAQTLPSHPQAGNVHLVAIQATYQQLKDPQQDRAAYLQLLEEHLDLWPQSMTVNRARVWLGNEHRRLGKMDQAIEVYQGVAVEFPQYVAVLEILEACWQTQLKALPENSPETRQAVGEAIHFFEALVLGTEGQFPRRWSPVTRYAALVAARFRIQGSNRGLEQVAAMLRAALTGEPSADPAWRFSASGLLALALAGQGKQEQADAIIRQLGAGEPRQIFQTVVALATLTRRATGNARTQLAQLQLILTAQLKDRTGQLSASDQLQFKQLRGQALADAGRFEEAQKLFQQLVMDQPRSGSIQETYAELLSASKDPQHWQQALQQWRRVGQFSPPKSARWYRSKYQVAETYLRLGKRQEAAARIRYLQATSGLEASGMQARFEALLKRCQP